MKTAFLYKKPRILILSLTKINVYLSQGWSV